MNTGLLVGAPLLVCAAALLWRRASTPPRARPRGRRQVGMIMSRDPASCRPETPLREVAELMVAHDCGEIPVCDAEGRPIAVVTDRDIVCRIVARGEDPLARTAEDCMSAPVVTCTPDMDVGECGRLTERHQVRRLPVVDAAGRLCGMVSQADLARKGPRPMTAAVVEKVSEPTAFASAVGA